MKPNVLLVDGDISHSELLAEWFSRTWPGMQEPVVVESGLEAWKLCMQKRPDLLIIELELPELCGAEVVARIRRMRPEVRVLVHTRSCNRALLIRALRARPQGFVEKGQPLRRFEAVVRSVLAGETWLSPMATSLLPEILDPAEIALTARDREVLSLVAGNLSSKEIASRLRLSAKTVQNRRQRIMEKIGIRGTAGLVRYAVDNGLAPARKD
jgi:DNA-binding NarL/FixJ family response regulator